MCERVTLTALSSGGAIDANGLYTAPTTAGSYSVTATSTLKGTYTGTTHSCQSSQSCGADSPARAVLEKSNGTFTLYLMDGTNLNTAHCGTAFNGGCLKLTGTGSGPDYNGIGRVNSEDRKVTASTSGTTMTARVEFVHTTTPWRDFALTLDP